MYVYVMGRAHTGSTILDILLGNSPKVESVGQLVSHIGRLDTACSCGEAIQDCGYWTEVRKDVLGGQDYDWTELSKLHTDQGHVKSLFSTFFSKRSTPRFQRLAQMTARIDRALKKVSGKEVVLDSSKEPTRGLFLLKHYDDARMIYLVRDPRSVVTSYYWRHRAGKPFHFLRKSYDSKWLWPFFLFVAAGSWIVGHAIFEAVARTAPGKVIRVRYEDLCTRPDIELRRIGEAFDIPVEEVIEKIERREGFPVGHNIGGNMIREGKKDVHFEPKKDLTRQPLPKWAEIMTLGLCWPLMGRYGYKFNEHAHRPPSDPVPQA